MDQTTSTKSPSLVTTALIIVTIIFPIISAVAIWLRVLARLKSKQPFLADDHFIFISWFLSLALSILVWVYASKSGINYYNVDFVTGTEASLEIDPVAFPLTKVSLRFNDTAFGLAQVATSFTLDILVLCLPIPAISRLNMKRNRKMAIIMIFWLGAFCAVASIVRTVLLRESIQEVISSNAYARVANQSKQYIFLVVEPNVSILAASLPTYGPLFTSGKGLESFFRSARSFFSLSGRGSGGRSHRIYESSTSNDPNKNQFTESQVELHRIENWSKTGIQEAHVSHSSEVTSMPSNLQNGISVTRGVTVRTE
ncbi:hypothetical protein BPOR_0236g00200 [Botrytis porri]|uniref:Rhodopsin domain-containing protein n=1 Tax=Botrytis porri TaxID=87229 RepID=A0A4Z1KMH8_9HELO|nr:hypothetical protein BPOR_0236g00200 [Botrytis porri]